MHDDLSQFMHPIINISALCISPDSFFNFFYESVAVFNFCGKSVGEFVIVKIMAPTGLICVLHRIFVMENGPNVFQCKNVKS